MNGLSNICSYKFSCKVSLASKSNENMDNNNKPEIRNRTKASKSREVFPRVDNKFS